VQHYSALPCVLLPFQAGVSAAAVAGMTALTHLQDLLINNTMQLLWPTSLAPLQHLTPLRLLQIRSANMRFSASNTPFLTSLSNLARLALLGFGYFELELLLSLPNLRSLQLQPTRRFGTVKELLLALAQCTALTELVLGRLDVPYTTVITVTESPPDLADVWRPFGPRAIDGPGPRAIESISQRQVAEVEPQDFAAVTASPVLQRLEIESSSILAQSWQHILREDLTQLRQLRLSNIQGE
jgi:hypothetical protein